MKIPFAEIQVDSPGQVPAAPQMDTRGMAQEAFQGGRAMGAAIGESLQKLGTAADVILEARGKAQVSNEVTGAAGELQDARLELEKDPDLTGRAAKFQQKAEEIRARRLEGISGYGTADFNLRFNQMFKPVELDVKQDARNQEIQGHKIDLADNLEKLANQAVFARSPLERTAAQAEADKQIQQAVAAGYLKASDVKTLQRAYLGNVDAALAAEQVRTNPGGAIAQLGDPNQFPNLDAAKRVQLRAQAQVRAESLGAQARAEARADAADIGADIRNAIANGTPLPPQDDIKSVVLRLGPKSATAVRLQHAYDFATNVQAETAGKSIPEIVAEATRLRFGTPAPVAPPGSDQPVAPTTNLEAAKAAMPDMTPQEENLYRRHLSNVVGPGGVTNKDGSRSTLFVVGTEIDGRYYLVPSVEGGKILKTDEAIARARAQGLDNFPSYANRETAEARYGKLHLFMERDIPRQAASSEDLRMADVLSGIAHRKIAEAARDPQLQSAVEKYLQAAARVADNKPPPSEQEGEDLIRRAGGRDTPTGAHVAQAMELARGLSDSLAKTPEELRAQAATLNVANAPAAQLDYANQLERLAASKEHLRAKDPSLQADIDETQKLIAAAGSGGGPLPERSRVDQMIEAAGGVQSAQGYLLNRNYQNAQAVVESSAGRSLPELARQINELRGTNASLDDIAKSHRLAVVAQQRQQQRDADEAGYIVKAYPTIGEKLAQAEQLIASNDFSQQQRGLAMRRDQWAAMLEAQQREGVAPQNAALLTKPQLEQVKGALGAEGADQRVATVVKLRDTYGDYWPLVQRQIYQGKPAPSDIQVIAALPAGAAVPSQAVAEAYKVTDQEASRTLGESVVKDIRDQTRNAVSGLASSMVPAPDGPKFVATYQEAIAKVAELYVMRGQNVSQAVTRAFSDLFDQHYKLADNVNGVKVRIPIVNGVPAAEPGDVSRAQQMVMAQLPDMDLMLPAPGRAQGLTPAQQKDQLVQVIRSSGYWMTTAGDGGMALMAGPGQYVRFSDGSPVVVPFDSAAAIATQRTSARAEARRLQGGSTGVQPPQFDDPSVVGVPSRLLQYYLTQPPPGSTQTQPGMGMVPR